MDKHLVGVTRDHLAVIAQRLAGVFIRDLHREEIGATASVVDAGRFARHTTWSMAI